jgi:sulfatase maturation enzyme AslB (radical SAM superfamily)
MTKAFGTFSPSRKEILPTEQAIMIKCRHCEVRDVCHRRSQKERYESMGIITHCVITPNRPKKRRKSPNEKIQL